VAHVSINFNGRSYRFACGENEVQRLEEVGKYLTVKLEELVREHGNIGDERLMLMAAIVIADELFDARADVDELLEGSAEDIQTIAARRQTAFG
jgi:cell division protein ZapA